MGVVGVEPTTNWLRVNCATTAPHTHVYIQFFVIVVASALPSYLKTILNYFYLGLLLHSDKSLISLSLSFALSSLLRAGFALLTRRPTQNPLGRVPHTHVFIQFFLLNYSSIKNNNCTTKIKGDKFVAWLPLFSFSLPIFFYAFFAKIKSFAFVNNPFADSKYSAGLPVAKNLLTVSLIEFKPFEICSLCP